MWSIAFASEKNMQKAAELLGSRNGAYVIFSQRCGEIIKDAPIAYVPDLWGKVEGLLEQNSDDNRG